MAQFPRYQSKEQINIQAPSVAAPQETDAQMMEQAGKVGGVVQDAALKWSNAVDTIQKTTATANFKSGMLDITSRAQNDPNYNNSEQYFKEIEKLKADSLKGFSSKAAEAEASINFDYDGKVGQIQIQNLYKKKMIEVGQISTMKLIDAEISNPNKDSFSEINRILNDQIKAGIYSREEAYKVYKASIKTIGAFDVANDPADQEENSAVLAELRKGEKGKYAQIPADDRLDLIKATQQRIFNNNQTYKRDVQDASNARSNSLIEKIAGGEASIKDIEAELSIPEQTGGIKRSQLLTYKRALVSGVKGDLDRMLREKTPDNEPTKRAKDVKSYLDLIDNFVDDNTDQLISKEMLATAFEDGIVNSKEQQFLNGMKQNLKDIQFNRRTDIVASSIKNLKSFFKLQTNSSDEDIARNIKTLIGDIQEGGSPDASLRKIMQKEVLRRVPDIASYPKTGKLKRDANGNIIRLFPDGTYVEEPAQKAKS